MVHASSRSDGQPLRFSLQRSYAVIVFVAALVLAWGFATADGDGEPVPSRHDLVATAPTIEGVLLHPLRHVSGWHLLLNVGVILVAGGMLESHWGTHRFLGFSVLVGAGVVIASLMLGWLASLAALLGDSTPRTYGASGFAFAYLVCVAVAFPRATILRGLSLAQGVWATILLGAAGLASLDAAAQAGPETVQGTFLAPQMSGVAFGMAGLWVQPRVDAWRRARVRLREDRARERAVDMRLQVDRLLDKISESGYDSLTSREKSFLRQASKHYKQER